MNEAIARKNSLDIGEDFLETMGEMSDAELEYFEVMVEVEALTSKLEKAERAFESVKHEIESLVKEYEDMLEDMDNSSSSSDEDCRSSRSESSASSSGRYERERLARRAQRAELNAEIAAKEIENKEKELVELRVSIHTELLSLAINQNLIILLFYSKNLTILKLRAQLWHLTMKQNSKLILFSQNLQQN